jgi:serine/threonine protein kinase
MAWKEGEKIGQYVLGRQLGQGGMATVYVAHHPHLDRDVAIKVMHQNFLDDAGFVARFKREAQIVGKLTHPHIVSVYDFDEHEGLPFLVMKYVQGKTLKQASIKKPLSVDEILRVMTAVGSALTYAHQEGVLHRDIKPSNIVLDKDETPYLTDFGLARLAAMGESTMSADMLLGTPHYISPEQAKGVKELDGRTDIYSLGVVLYELLVGHVPYTGDTPYSIIHDHIYTPLPSPSKINPEIPEAIEAVLYKALAKKADERYSTADDMVRAFRNAVDSSNLKELNPERVNVAAVSIAKNRQEYDNELTITPSPEAVAAAIPSSTPSGMRMATMKSKNAPKNERIWPIGGCASLLLILFASIGILLSMSQNLLELRALSESTNFDAASEMLFLPVLEIPQEYAELGILMEEGEFPSLLIPELESAQIPVAPSDPVGYLLRARGLYQVEDISGARQAIAEGLPEDNQTIYLSSAAKLAADSGDTDAALLLAIAAAENARSESELLFEIVRPYTGEFVYETAATTELLDVTTTLQELTSSGIISAESVSVLENSPMADFAIMRNLIANGNFVLAQRRLSRISEDSPLYAEFLLLKGELAIASGENETAVEFLESIDDLEDVPEWVENRAGELLDTLN